MTFLPTTLEDFVFRAFETIAEIHPYADRNEHLICHSFFQAYKNIVRVIAYPKCVRHRACILLWPGRSNLCPYDRHPLYGAVPVQAPGPAAEEGEGETEAIEIWWPYSTPRDYLTAPEGSAQAWLTLISQRAEAFDHYLAEHLEETNVHEHSQPSTTSVCMPSAILVVTLIRRTQTRS